jgi:hypothetical protein
MTGTQARRVRPGALHVWSGDVLVCLTATWDQATHPLFLARMRAPWRGWPIVLLEERGAPHTAAVRRQ